MNPALNSSGHPVRFAGETQSAIYKHAEYEIEIDEKEKKIGKGICILTQYRLIVLNDKSHTSEKFHGIEIPLTDVKHDEFEQPLFGANYIHFKIKVKHSDIAQKKLTFKMWFMQGGY